jgi:phospholipase A2
MVSTTTTESELSKRDGIGIVYIPLIRNDEAAPGFDPLDVSTWRRELSIEESDRLLSVAKVCHSQLHMWAFRFIDILKASMVAGQATIRRVVKSMWLRKRRIREGAPTPP